ncbi:unnamed protein product [Mytilus coruscus]|uniref:ZMYM2-like/QRICH1 C-terminal domain-containing protein n=1 Tax=Mytilus coruscus TaxID=42192 RepID=A0A6J8D1V6_MYTCO|nr:unnamed protein product [Mytilus coruscus]
MDEVPNFRLEGPWSDLDDLNEIEGDIYDDELSEALLYIIQPVDDTELSEHTISAPTTENIAVTLVPNNETQNLQNTETQNVIISDQTSNPQASNPHFNQSFLEMDESYVRNFIDGQQNKNTVTKTACDMGLNGNEYEPSSLRGIVGSIDRTLKYHKYGHTIITEDNNYTTFNLTRNALKAKQKTLKKEGKGNKPKRADPLTDDEIDLLFEKNLLGSSNPQSLLNIIWLNNSIHFGLRGVTEHYTLRWGDIIEHRSSDGTRYLQLNERPTKTRTGDKIADVHEVAPKTYEYPGDRNPLAFYDLYVSKRPSDFSAPDSPFYIAPRTIPIDDKKDLRSGKSNRKLGKKTF